MPFRFPDIARSVSIFGLVFAGLLFLAGSANAIRFDLNQIGGTAVGGYGAPGDTLVLSIDVTLEADDGSTGLITALQWDLEGGDVLDITRGTETSFEIVNSVPIFPISGVYRMGDPTTHGERGGRVSVNVIKNLAICAASLGLWTTAPAVAAPRSRTR